MNIYCIFLLYIYIHIRGAKSTWRTNKETLKSFSSTGEPPVVLRGFSGGVDSVHFSNTMSSCKHKQFKQISDINNVNKIDEGSNEVNNVYSNDHYSISDDGGYMFST